MALEPREYEEDFVLLPASEANLLADEIARLQAQLAAEQARHRETEDIATGALHGALESLAASQALVVELADALKTLRHRMLYKTGMGDTAQQYGGTPSDNAAMTAADAALAKVGR